MNLVPVVAYLHLSSDGKPDQAACACIHSTPLTDLGVVQHRSVCRVAVEVHEGKETSKKNQAMRHCAASPSST